MVNFGNKINSKKSFSTLDFVRVYENATAIL